MGAACRASPEPERLGLCKAVLLPSRHGHWVVEYDLQVIASQSPSASGTCWHQLFNNPVIAQGYPIPVREAAGEDDSKFVGLELSLGLMAVLGQVPRAVTLAKTTMLKGFISMFVPMLRHGSSTLWHFMLSAKGCRLSYNEGLATALLEEPLDSDSIVNGRHFVGWTPNAEILAGESEHPGCQRTRLASIECLRAFGSLMKRFCQPKKRMECLHRLNRQHDLC
jgi:hypothetical protein